jgi:hypothetical protein
VWCEIPVDIDVCHHVFLLLLLLHRKGRLCIVNLSHQLQTLDSSSIASDALTAPGLTHIPATPP